MSRSDSEKYVRMNNFKKTLKFITETNSAEESTFKLGLNKFSDWTRDELERHTGLIPDNNENISPRFGVDPISDAETLFPLNNQSHDSWDWTEHQVVTPAKNQGQCGSCFAFAFVGVLESNYAIRHGTSREMSEQQFVDCAALSGCKGSNFVPCYNYMKSKHWYVQSASNYPYIAIAQSCQVHHPSEIHVGEKLYKRVPTNDEVALKTLLRKYGPVYISFNVGNRANESPLLTDISKKFSAYSSGIFDVPGCNEKPRQNHAMLLVGYGQDRSTGLDYWKVKNSWGSTWGEKGFIRVRRGVNMGGIAANAYYIGSLSSF
ncbi:unnamed protein product [Didymodactylos carnosus]|uniref:Uncharacterized protein n=1 Tax=Didymodactylos carnosus TaxID=1234261 RepID=A0A815Z809_9BILA|nr:unnamed protein product [Didymodactylos carnosus]CAF1578936.1 unnamed protein product [Didymodactylos carnosus]CAF4286584.1 unnamed protein product [Didymodactylos carnosus]CAF4445544.1 unnamed protein product [Didymodactylos carnosus]